MAKVNIDAAQLAALIAKAESITAVPGIAPVVPVVPVVVSDGPPTAPPPIVVPPKTPKAVKATERDAVTVVQHIGKFIDGDKTFHVALLNKEGAVGERFNPWPAVSLTPFPPVGTRYGIPRGSFEAYHAEVKSRQWIRRFAAADALLVKAGR